VGVGGLVIFIPLNDSVDLAWSFKYAIFSANLIHRSVELSISPRSSRTPKFASIYTSSKNQSVNANAHYIRKWGEGGGT